jgi:FixJ family two-component response regulator
MGTHATAFPLGKSGSLATLTIHQLEFSRKQEATPVVFVVDGDSSVRESLAMLIRRHGWRSEAFASAEEFLARPRTFAPGCLILDVSFPGSGALELQKRLAADRPEIPIICVAGRVDIPTTVQAMKAGAIEFLMKPFREDLLLTSMREAIERSRSALGYEAELQVLRERYASLTPREQQVMRLVVSGLLNKQVGGELGISEITVKAHRGQVMQKMQANSLADLVRIAEKLRVTFTPTKLPIAAPFWPVAVAS